MVITRNASLDAYRGLAMLLMMAEVLRLSHVARAFPGSMIWGIVAFNQSHAPWAGCSIHDLIQPSFSFLVGAALPYSIGSRIAKGGSFRAMAGHAVWRSLVLIALGVFLRSTHAARTNFTFEDTLSQIGLGYPFLFLLGFQSARAQWTALWVILIGYWSAWALYPIGEPLAGFPHNFQGFAAHWNKQANLGNAFDQWFLNLFPRPTPFIANGGGYLTLSFIPTLGTMILGLRAGSWLRAVELPAAVRRMAAAGSVALAAGLGLHFAGVCPIVKRIWTPSWTLFSGGACFLVLAGLTWILDIQQRRRWAFPLIVIGMNSIAAYLMAHLFEAFIVSSLRIHAGPLFLAFGKQLEIPLLGAATLAVYWWMLHWMHRRNLFLRV